MTLNEARDKVVAACKTRRSVKVQAEAWYWSHYDGVPRARRAEFTITIFPVPLRVFHGPDLGALVAQAVAFVSQPSMDAPAECKAEKVGRSIAFSKRLRGAAHEW